MFKKRTMGIVMAIALLLSACGGAKKTENDTDSKKEKEVVETANEVGEGKEGKEGKRVIKVSTKFVDYWFVYVSFLDGKLIYTYTLNTIEGLRGWAEADHATI